MSECRAAAEVDVSAVQANCRRLKAALGADRELCAVVKADAYGHGAVACAAAALEGGATRLAVATAAEAAEVRAAQPRVPLLTLGPLTAAELDLALAARSEVSVCGPASLAAACARAAEVGVRARVHVKFDSGMGRLGTDDPGELLAVARRAAADPHAQLVGAWTHFATADDLGSRFFDLQLNRFEAVARTVKSEFPRITLHAANSAATLREPRSHFDMARCGVAIYGLDPFQRDPASQGLVPALKLRSHLAQVRRLAAGTSVGYGRTWRAPRETLVGLIPLGYADGLRRGLSNRGTALVGGRRRRLVGTVSMDSAIVDLGPAADAEVGDEAVLIGAQGGETILAEELARELGTINYEVACGVSNRVPREYRPASSQPRF